jgi:hypothetical protein
LPREKTITLLNSSETINNPQSQWMSYSRTLDGPRKSTATPHHGGRASAPIGPANLVYPINRNTIKDYTTPIAVLALFQTSLAMCVNYAFSSHKPIYSEIQSRLAAQRDRQTSDGLPITANPMLADLLEWYLVKRTTSQVVDNYDCLPLSAIWSFSL